LIFVQERERERDKKECEGNKALEVIVTEMKRRIFFRARRRRGREKQE